MPKLDLNNLSVKQSNQILTILKREIQSFEGDKNRAIEELNKVNSELNEASEELRNIKKTLKAKEDALIEKYNKKEEELDKKITEAKGRATSASAKEGELDGAIKKNKDSEANHNREADIARTSNSKAVKLLDGLAGIAKYVESTIKTLKAL